MARNGPPREMCIPGPEGIGGRDTDQIQTQWVGEESLRALAEKISNATLHPAIYDSGRAIGESH